MFASSNPQWSRLTIPVVILSLLLLAINIAFIAGWRWNVTPSLPLGPYQLEKGVLPVRGDYVSFCSPVAMPFMPSGPCNGTAPLMKEVIAAEGDVVEIDPDKVTVNGRKIPYSASLQHSTAYPDASIPHAYGRHVLTSGQVWVFGSGDPIRSFDSRYYGPVAVSSLIGVVKK